MVLRFLSLGSVGFLSAHASGRPSLEQVPYPSPPLPRSCPAALAPLTGEVARIGAGARLELEPGLELKRRAGRGGRGVWAVRAGRVERLARASVETHCPLTQSLTQSFHEPRARPRKRSKHLFCRAAKSSGARTGVRRPRRGWGGAATDFARTSAGARRIPRFHGRRRLRTTRRRPVGRHQNLQSQPAR